MIYRERPDLVVHTPKHKMLTKHISYYYMTTRCCLRAILTDHNYVVSPDTDQCPDTLQCDEFASCIRNQTGFACQCNDGFHGNGRTCKGMFFFNNLILNMFGLTKATVSGAKIISGFLYSPLPTRTPYILIMMIWPRRKHT